VATEENVSLKPLLKDVIQHTKNIKRPKGQTIRR